MFAQKGTLQTLHFSVPIIAVQIFGASQNHKSIVAPLLVCAQLTVERVLHYGTYFDTTVEELCSKGCDKY